MSGSFEVGRVPDRVDYRFRFEAGIPRIEISQRSAMARCAIFRFP